MAEKKYVSLSNLTTFFDNLKNLFATKTEMNTKSDKTHTHFISDISSLQTTLDEKAVSSHTHEVSDVSDLTVSASELNTLDGIESNVQTQIDNRVPLTRTVNGKALSSNISLSAPDVGAAASSHTHTIANVTNLQSTLDGKSDTSHTHNTIYIPDTRSDNQNPAWYISNYPKQVVTEFKYVSVIGLSGATYCKLTTYIQWSNNSGDYPSQEAIVDGRLYTRQGVSDTAWSSWKTNIDSNNISSQSVATAGSCTGNSVTVTKLQMARTIGLGTGATGTATSFNGTANITIPVTDIKESYLSWGGKNLSGSVSPIDVACSNIHSANRFTFAKPDGITIEYSTDGSTYNTYSTTDSAKVNLVSGIGSVYYIGARSSSTTVNDKLRITLSATNMGLYTRLRKLLINITTNYSTGSNVIIEKSMKGSESTYATIGAYPISGWSGWNSIPISAAFGGGNNQTSNIANLRLTFGITGVNSAQTSNALTVMDVIGIGDTYWSYPSTMAKTGHIYTYDSSQNATFPANITADTFVGALSGNAATATTASACSGNAATATKLATARTISLTGDVTGSASFDGSANASITATVADDSHNHIISNIDGLQTALNGKSSTSHNHDSTYVSKNLQFTDDDGNAELKLASDSSSNLLTEIASLEMGFHTFYSASGNSGNPKQQKHGVVLYLKLELIMVLYKHMVQ